MKMYILVRESVPTGYAVNSVAHASLACFLQHAANKDMQRWLAFHFKKVTCRVTDEEFAQARNAIEGCQQTVITESALGDQIVAVAFVPREEWPECFSEYPPFK